MDTPLLSDWNGEATRAFDVSFEPLGMHDVPLRSAFLIRDGETIEAAWLLGGELPDVDAVLEAARSSAPREPAAEVAPPEPPGEESEEPVDPPHEG